MKSRLLVAAVAFLGYAILNATPANAATTYTWVGGGNGCTATAWSCNNNWNPSTGYPGSASGDSAIVPDTVNDPVLDVDLTGTSSAPYEIQSLQIQQDAEVYTSAHTMRIAAEDGLWVKSGAVFHVEASGQVTISGGGDDHWIDGQMRLIGSGSKLNITTTSLVVLSHSGTAGSIVGQDPDAEISIAAVDGSVELESEIEISGQLKITGAGDFLNDGKVIANAASGTLDFRLTGTIDDVGGDGVNNERWQVTASEATLQFLNTPAAMEGRFFVSDGTLRAGEDPEPDGDEVDVVTAGHLRHTGGVIVAGEDDSFTFNN
jgi:hypothetical protein